MKHTITLTTQELETIYFALNTQALRYMDRSATWGKTFEELMENGLGLYDDYAAKRAREIGNLQVRIGDVMAEQKNTIEDENLVTV